MGTVKIIKPGNPNVQSLYASNKADKALEEKKNKCEWVKGRIRICRVRGPQKIKFNLKNCKAEHLREINAKPKHTTTRLKPGKQ